ncbi:MAG: hypothetical protein R6U63_11700 [Longimicrobiales bacterium]
MRALAAYGVASGALLLVLAAVVAMAVEPADPAGVRLAAWIAWPVQLAAFGALLAGRAREVGFVAGWVGGMALRFAAVGAAAVWVTRVEGPDPASLLVSLVGFVFVLVLLEPLFLRLTN